MTMSILIILVFLFEKLLFKIIILAVIGLIYYAFKAFQANDFNEKFKKKFNESGYVKIANFPEGEVCKFIGTVELVGEPIISPFSKQECALYHFRVEELTSPNSLLENWEKRLEEAESCKFVIRDGDHVAYLADDILEDLLIKSRWEKRTKTIEEFHDRWAFKFDVRNFIGMWKYLRYAEARLEPGEKVLVWGKGEWKKAIEFQLPDHFNDILVITSKDDKGIFVSDEQIFFDDI